MYISLLTVDQTTTEPHSPWENPSEPNIGQLRSMVRNATRAFDVPLKENYRANKQCVDVQIIDSYKNLKGRFPIKISEGYTQDISKFRFHLWEPI